MRARLGRYGAWQLRDFVFERGLPSLVVATLMLFPTIVGLRAMIPMNTGNTPASKLALDAFTSLMVGPFGFVIVLIATNGIVHGDIRRGYYRFLFAKPVAPWRFYAQSFAVSWLGAMLVALLVLAAFAVLVTPIFPPGLFAFLSLYYVALGGLVFLMSVITRLDWLIVATIWTFAQLLRAMYPASSGLFGRIVDVLLPPAHRIGEVGTALLQAGSPGGVQLGGDPTLLGAIIWLAGWGTLAFIAGLVILRRKPLAS